MKVLTTTRSTCVRLEGAMICKECWWPEINVQLTCPVSPHTESYKAITAPRFPPEARAGSSRSGIYSLVAFPQAARQFPFGFVSSDGNITHDLRSPDPICPPLRR